ncbi:alpha-2-macroglobulin [Legionella geestiana]|uniref:alpha-2-macroglobulin n=1 Tax=Legionella geestiana TaxID=45065 RepID=UPI0010922665|nr:alpha-2-macroglobulin [Legionella geestiana]QDQ38995.1 alpha-2-macroglobulin [Legionella geestiana]
MKSSVFARAFTAIRSTWHTLAGEISWTKPRWCSRLKDTISKNPRKSLLALGITVLFSGALYSYLHLPTPPLARAVITPPEKSLIKDNILTPAPLVIRFQAPDQSAQSAAPLQDIGKVLTRGVILSPEHEGRWSWKSDSELVFTPLKDWPAGTAFTVDLTPSLLTPGLKLASLHADFKTLPLKVRVKDFKLYQNPTNPLERVITATLHFNFPVNPESLAKALKLFTETPKNSALQPERFSFTLKYDKFRRRAWLRTETVKLTDSPRFVVLDISDKILAASSDAHLANPERLTLLVPDRASYFRVKAMDTRIIRDANNVPRQVLTLETTLGVKDATLQKAVHAWLLPEHVSWDPDNAQHAWQSPGEVTPEILEKSTPVQLTPEPSGRPWSTLHGWQFDAPASRYVYVRLDTPLKAFGGFSLSRPFETVLQVPAYPKEVGFLHKGSLMALAGERKLSVTVRGLPAVRFELSRVRSGDINHLVTQTRGDMSNPAFVDSWFGAQNISEVFSEIQPFDASNPAKLQYHALDFDRYLKKDGKGFQGLFLLRAQGFDPVNNVALEAMANRLILLTDMGLIVKDNVDGSHEVLTTSITEGGPVANADITVLGKNGLPIASSRTDAQGHAHFPPLTQFTDAEEPVVYLAQNGNDVSFIPFSSGERQLNFSRFDTGGLYSGNQGSESLSAYLFTDRGLYRPGETIHLGAIVKQLWLQPQPAGVPLKIQVADARGTLLVNKALALDNNGFFTLDIPLTPTSPTGQYDAYLYLAKDALSQSLLGSVSLRVAEFEPDSMRIRAETLPATEGWVNPKDLRLKVRLANLYGGAGVNRRVTARMTLEPRPVQFEAYPDFVFANPLQKPGDNPKTVSLTLPEATTNDEGVAEFKPDFQQFGNAIWFARFYTEGFEPDSGKSVSTEVSTLISPLSAFVGYRADGALGLLHANTPRKVHLLAVNSALKPTALEGLTLELVEWRPVSTLVKTADGNLQYQTLQEARVLRSMPLALKEAGMDISLPTDTAGTFQWVILDKARTVLNHIDWSVAGAGAPTDYTSAEMVLKTDKETYAPGEEITLQINAPYAGSGVMTIERDRVMAVQWFKTETPESVQKIRVPEALKGNGYVNVIFLRDWNSPELFASPMRFALAPFSVNHDKETLNIRLDTAKSARPGDTLKVHYQSDKPAQMIVFGVDEGILQVARYHTPDPLGFFFQKRALEVLTRQTVDLILPQFLHARERSAVGGDEGDDYLAGHLNPFRRRAEAPVAFWSGLLEAGPEGGTLEWPLPDYFNGSLRIMAVAVGSDIAGNAETQTLVRGDFVINPVMPTFVAPLDTFDLSATIANNLKNSGEKLPLGVRLSVSEGLTLLSPAEITLPVDEGKEGVVHFRLQASRVPGTASVRLEVQHGDTQAHMESSLSIRPLMPHTRTEKMGLTRKTALEVPLSTHYFRAFYNGEAAISTNPLILTQGLARFLEAYPWGCTEQLTSQAFARLSLLDDPTLSNERASALERLSEAFGVLASRQLANGCISYWPNLGDTSSNPFSSVYAMHFLTDAGAKNLPVPKSLISGGLSCLRELAGAETASAEQAKLQAYATYVLTRNGIVTTPWVTHLLETLDAHPEWHWKKDITAVYLAATLKELQSPDEANRLVAGYHQAPVSPDDFSFMSGAAANAQYYYLLARHFPDLLHAAGLKPVESLVKSLGLAEVNTLTAAYTSLALSAMGDSANPGSDADLGIAETRADGLRHIPAARSGFVSLSPDATRVHFDNPKGVEAFWQVSQSGFSTRLPEKPLVEGLEVYREYRDREGNAVTQAANGDVLEVHIQIRATGEPVSSVALVDLLPGGFEVVRDSVTAENMEYADVREDRVVFFGYVDTTAKSLVYRIRAISAGTYGIPPVFAESMYTPRIRGLGVSGTLQITASGE